MLDPFARPGPGTNRLSRPALVTAVAVHLGVLSVALNSAPMVRSAQAVVYQWVGPITPLPEVAEPITQASRQTPAPVVAPVAAALQLPPEPSPPPRTAITERAQPPEPEPIKPLEPKVAVTVAPTPLPVPTPIPIPIPVPMPVLVPVPVLLQPSLPSVIAAPPPEPALQEALKPLPEPSRVRREPVPLPSTLPALESKIDAVSSTVQVRIQTPLTAVPPPTVPMPMLAPAPPSASETVKTTPAASPVNRPLDALPAAVSPPLLLPLPARPSAITATDVPPSGGAASPAGALPAAAGGSSGSLAGPGSLPPDAGRSIYPAGPPSMLRNPLRERSAAEMAREQLTGDGSRNRLGEAVDAARKPECFGKDVGAAYGILSLPIGAVLALRDKCK